MARPAEFFTEATRPAGLRAPLTFGAAAATAGAICQATLGLASTWLTLSSLTRLAAHVTQDPQLMRQLAPAARTLLLEADAIAVRLFGALAGASLVSIALAPLAAVLGLLVLAALTHPIARWLGGCGSFESTVRVLGYASVAQLFAVIPGAAPVVSLVLVTVGIQRAHGLSTPRSLLAAGWWIPLAFAALVAGALGFAVALFARLA